MEDILKAKAMLTGDMRCVVIKGDKLFTSKRRGIAPLIELYDSGEDYSGLVAADKIVGKAAAFIYVKLGAKEVYASVMSREAQKLFGAYGIKYSFSEETTIIRNREKTGMCPMEQAVADISDPDAAIVKLRETVEALKNRNRVLMY